MSLPIKVSRGNEEWTPPIISTLNIQGCLTLFTQFSFLVPQDLATLFEELQREKKLKSHQKLSETLKNLLYCVASCPCYVAKDLMRVLQGVHGEVSAVSGAAFRGVSLRSLKPLLHRRGTCRGTHVHSVTNFLLIWERKRCGGEKRQETKSKYRCVSFHFKICYFCVITDLILNEL